MLEGDDMVRKKRHEDMADAIRDSMTSGAVTGGVYGAAGRLLAGGRSPGSLLKAGVLGAATYAPLAGGTTALGSKVLGTPDDDDPTAYTTRGLVGGVLGGGAIGAGVGALLGRGRLAGLAHLPGAGKIAEMAERELPLNNLIVDKLKHWARNPSGASSGKSAALLSAILGGGAGAIGGSEGMQLDFARNLARHRSEDSPRFDQQYEGRHMPMDDQEDGYDR